MEINKNFLGKLFEQAVENPRLRQSFDLRTSSEDNSQRILNALLPGTVVPIHRHPNSNENVLLLCGKLVEVIYDEMVRKKSVSILILPLAIMVVCCLQVHGIQLKYWNHRLYTKPRMESMVKMAVKRLILSKLKKRKTIRLLQRHKNNEIRMANV